MPVSFSLLAGAGAQFFDNNGNILSGGKLYTYLAGTTTPQPAYTDSTGSVAHSNPIILDGSGRIPYGEIWVTTGVAYKFTLYTPANVLLATWDNVPDIKSALNGSGTNNAVAYYNSTGNFTSSANLTFNGTNLTVAGAVNAASAAVSGNAVVTGTIASTGGITSATPAVTQAYNDSSTKIATTAFVRKYADIAKIQFIGATVGSGALTVILNPTVLDFRNISPTSSSISTVNVPSVLNLSVPAGSTLGAASGVATKFAVLAVNNSGTVQLAIANIGCGLTYDETTNVTTTTSAALYTSIYSSSTVTAPYRVVGYIIATNTSGNWTSVSFQQGAGGNALSTLTGFGISQTYSVPSPLVSGTTYYNTTGRPIQFYLRASSPSSSTAILGYVNGVNVAGAVAVNSASEATLSMVVPPGLSYSISWTTNAPTVYVLS